jgi:hypothetical protein
MKQRAAILVIMLLTGILATCLPARADPTLTPHEDPSTAQSTMDVYSFLTEYATIFSLMSNQLYGNASRLSEQLSHITVPAEFSYIINRYNNLTQQLNTVLNDLQGTLDSASSLLDQNRLSAAEQELDHASILVAKAQILLSDLKDATSTVSQRLGVFANAPQSSTQQAYNQLQSMLEKLNQLIERYHTLLDKANQRAEEIKAESLDATTLTLSLNSTIGCYVGSTISAAGTLTSKGAPLGNREVKLYIDGAQAKETSTDTNGNYQTVIKIPYKYVDSITIQAIYSPTGNDKDKYLAAVSPTITLKLLFYNTTLEFSAPDIGYPGLPVTVTGKVTDTNGELTKRQVNIFLDGTLETRVVTNQNGTFIAKFTINTQTALSKHSLTLTVDAQDLYNSASKQKTITIQKMATELQVDAPTFLILPAQLEITGKATSASGHLKEATIQVEYANISSTTKTQDDGSFNLTIEVPLNTALAGNQELKVQVQPSEPWQATAKTTKNIFALNSVSTSVAFASLFSVFAVAYLKLTKSKKTEKDMLESKPAMTTIPSIHDKNNSLALPVVDKTKFSGARGNILQAYREALTVVQTLTGTQLAQNMTLREYVQVTQPKIVALVKEFKELTGLTEKSLYSPYEPQPQETEKAEELSKAIRRNLNATA